MAYSKSEVQAVADAIFTTIKAAGEEGADIGKILAAGIPILTAIGAAMNEFKEDTDAAGLHLAARLADRFGDSRVNPETPEVVQ